MEEAMVRFLQPDGSFSPTPDAERFARHLEDLSLEDIQRFYEDMYVVRQLDTEATHLQRRGELGLWVPVAGQEAIQVGATCASRKQDMIFPSYREHAVLHVRGIDLVTVAELFRGTAYTNWKVEAHKVWGYTLVIAAHLTHATGYAMGIRFDGKCATGNPDTDEAVMVWFGDGASSQGDVAESMVFAARYRTPQVFMLQNNQYAISVPSSTPAAGAPLYRRGEGFGIPGVRVDGNDALAAYAVARDALERARAGEGPQLIEAYTYRLGAHTSSDDPSRYRSEAEYEYWLARDPLIRLRIYLQQQGVSEEWFAALEQLAQAQTVKFREAVLAIQTPPAETMFDNVYAASHPVMQAQQEWLLEFEKEVSS